VHDVSEISHEPDEPPVVEDLNWLLQQARKGDENTLPQLRDLLDTRPEVWQHFGNLAGHAREAWLRVISANDLALRESTARKAEDLMRELAGPHPSPIERLLAERVILCWLQLHYADFLAAQAFTKSTKLTDIWSKRQASAHRRYLTSLGALVTLRRLLPGQASGPPIDSRNLDTSSKNLESSVSRPIDREHQLQVVGEPM